MADFNNRKVSSVTSWKCIYKLRRAAQLLTSATDFAWLIEIEKDLALVMEPRSKLDRLVLTEQLVEAGLTMMTEAKDHTKAKFVRARGIRNGLMLALLALYPIRRKNFAALEIGKTFKEVKGRWWITLSGRATKMRSPEERPIAEWMNPYVKLYLDEARPVLLKPLKLLTDAFWVSSQTGQPLSGKDITRTDYTINRRDCGRRDFAAFVSNGRRHYGRGSERRHASSCKRVAQSQTRPRYRRALQSGKQPPSREPIRRNHFAKVSSSRVACDNFLRPTSNASFAREFKDQRLRHYRQLLSFVQTRWVRPCVAAVAALSHTASSSMASSASSAKPAWSAFANAHSNGPAQRA